MHRPPPVGTVAGHWGLRSVTVGASTPELAPLLALELPPLLVPAVVPLSRPPQPRAVIRATVETRRAVRGIGVDVNPGSGETSG